MNQNKNNITNEIKNLIEEKLLVDTSLLNNDDDLKNTLGIDPEIDLPLLISDISQKYHLLPEATEILSQATTLNQLVSIVIEEMELG